MYPLIMGADMKHLRWHTGYQEVHGRCQVTWLLLPFVHAHTSQLFIFYLIIWFLSVQCSNNVLNVSAEEIPLSPIFLEGELWTRSTNMYENKTLFHLKNHNSGGCCCHEFNPRGSNESKVMQAENVNINRTCWIPLVDPECSLKIWKLK